MSCSLCGKRGHLSHVCRSGGNASARAVEVEPAKLEGREIQHVWALSVCDVSGLPVGRFCLFATTPISRRIWYLLKVILDSGAEEHVVSLADWKSLGEPVLKLLKFDCAMRLVTTWSFWQFMVHGWCDDQMVELTALVATRAARSLCSATSGECWLQRTDEADSVCFASQWRRLHTASTLR